MVRLSILSGASVGSTPAPVVVQSFIFPNKFLCFVSLSYRLCPLLFLLFYFMIIIFFFLILLFLLILILSLHGILLLLILLIITHIVLQMFLRLIVASLSFLSYYSPNVSVLTLLHISLLIS